MMLTHEQIDNRHVGPKLLGIAGKAGSGKTTAADHLVSLGWTRVKLAGPLKDMLRAIGLTDQHLEGDLKEVPCDLLCGQTPRHAMLTLGTEWGRDMIGGDFWTGIAAGRIRAALAAGQNVVVDDVRFDNEAGVIRDLGGTVLKIERGVGVAVDHVSESGVDADTTYQNEGSLEELQGFMEYVFHRA